MRLFLSASAASERQRVDEVAAEQRRVLLGAVARRGDDGRGRAPRVLDERAAGARRCRRTQSAWSAASSAARRSRPATCPVPAG